MDFLEIKLVADRIEACFCIRLVLVSARRTRNAYSAHQCPSGFYDQAAGECHHVGQLR